MGGKKFSQRSSGRGAALAAASSESQVQLNSDLLAVFPADPDDARFTLEGLPLESDGKVDIYAFKDLMPLFAQEPPPAFHPDPEHPGVRRGEQIPKGLRTWDDVRAGARSKDGAGWIAVRYNKDKKTGKQEKWFNIRQCGSWRMAFLLASLQRRHWDARTAWLKAPINPIGTSVVKEELPIERTPRKHTTAPIANTTGEEAAVSQLSGEEAAVSQLSVSNESRVNSPAASGTSNVQLLATPKRKRTYAEMEPSSVPKSIEKHEWQESINGKQEGELLPILKTKFLGVQALASSKRLRQVLAARGKNNE